MNGIGIQWGGLIVRGLRRLRVASGILCAASAATAGQGASAQVGGSAELHTSPASAPTAPAIVPGATPMPPPPTGATSAPVIRPGEPSRPIGAAPTNEILIAPRNEPQRHTEPAAHTQALPIISPAIELRRPVLLGGPIEIVPQSSPVERPRNQPVDQALPREPQPSDSPEVQILPAPQQSDYVELPAPAQ